MAQPADDKPKTVRSKQWLPLESNPAVMTKYIHNLGASKEWQFHDVFGVDDALLGMIPQPCLGLLLLFPISAASEKHKQDEDAAIKKNGQEVSKKLYYMKQTVGNACGTIGLIHALMNVSDKVSFEKGRFFQKFLEETKDMTPEQRAKALEENKDIEVEHQEIAADEANDSSVPQDLDAVNLHFVALVCVDGILYELDGRKSFPINHGKTSSQTFLTDAAKVIKAFMARDPNEVRFNVVSLGPSE